MQMSMEINGTRNPTPGEMAEANKSAASGKTPGDATGAPTATVSAGDTFSLTDKAAQLRALEAQIATLPVVDAQRVQDVQHSLSTGTYEVEPARVADKMLQFESGLSSRT